MERLHYSILAMFLVCTKHFLFDQDKFKELYERAERNTRLRKKVIGATELFSMFMEERKNTGRIYPTKCRQCK